jgi:hypothetical protein
MDVSRRNLSRFTQNSATNIVPLVLKPLESAFIVFRQNATLSNSKGNNFPNPILVETIDSPWKVQFNHTLRGQLKPVIFNQL